MKVRIIAGAGADRYSWLAVKGFFVLTVVAMLFHPVTRGRTAGDTSGARTILPARIHAGEMYTLSTEAGGRLVYVSVEPGSAVRSGDVLAEIRNPELENLIERTKTRVAILEQRLAVKPEWNGMLDEQQRAAVRTYENAVQRQRDYSPADFEESYKRARQKSESLKALLAQNVVTAHEYEDAQRNEQGEKRNLMAAREHAKRLQQEAEAADSQLRMVKMQRKPAAADPSVRLDYDEAVAALRAAEDRQAALIIVAPRAGTVLEVASAAGSTVPSGTPLFKIADLSTLRFDVAVAAAIARTVRRGEPVLVRLPTDPPAEIASTVAHVLLMPDNEQQSYVIRVNVANPVPGRMLVGLEGAVVFLH